MKSKDPQQKKKNLKTLKQNFPLLYASILFALASERLVDKMQNDQGPSVLNS